MQRQYIYRNLTTGRWQYGSKPKQPHKGADGKAIRHSDVFAINVSFKESAASWRRCLANARNPASKQSWDVHAFAIGDIVDKIPASAMLPGNRVAITYDKWNSGRFIRKDTGEAIAFCQFVWFASDGHCYAVGEIRNA